MIQSNFSMQMLDLDTYTKTVMKSSKEEETHRRNEVSVMCVYMYPLEVVEYLASLSAHSRSHTNSAIPICPTNLFLTTSWSQMFEFSCCLEQLCSWLKWCLPELWMIPVAKIRAWITRNRDCGSCYNDTWLFCGWIRPDLCTLFSSCSGFHKGFFRCKRLKTALICTN